MKKQEITLRPVRISDAALFGGVSDIPCLLYDEYGGIIRNVESFLENRLARGMATTTLRAYAYDLLSFYRFLGRTEVPINELALLGSGVRYVLALREKGAAPRTINRRITTVRAFLNFHKVGLGDKVFASQAHSFYKGIRNKALLGKTRIKGKKKESLSVKVPSTIITPLSPTETKQFLSRIRTCRDIAVAYLMLFCGLRSCEVLSLEINDIDFAGAKLRIRGKGGKERFIPMSSVVNKNLLNYLNYERPHTSHNRCFVSLKGFSRGQPMTPEGLRMIFRHRRRHSLKKANPHLFRHTFCTNLITHGVPLPIVQRLMGHNDIETTLAYVHMSIDDLAREYKKATNSLEKNYETDETKTA